MSRNELDRIDRLAIRVLSGEADEVEQRQFDELKRDEAAGARIRLLTRIWSSPSPAESNDLEPDQVIKRLQERIRKTRKRSSK